MFTGGVASLLWVPLKLGDPIKYVQGVLIKDGHYVDLT